LTRAEAGRRAELLRVDSYQVDLDLTTSEDTFRSITEISFSCAEPGAWTFLDLIAPTVHEVVLNGRGLDPATVHTDGRIVLDGLAETNVVRVVADCAFVRTGEGLHRAVDPVDGEAYLYTQFEAPNARTMYATFEQPDLKATWQLSVTAPAGWQVVSNSPTPAPIPIDDIRADDAHTSPRVRWEFASTPRISTYITALVAGPYHAVHDTHTVGGKDIPLGLYCRRSLAEYLDADEIFAVTKQGFDFFTEAFDYPYPFEKYDQLFVPEYNAGAMENAGCVTFRDEYIFRSKVTDTARQDRADVILHEMAHMWFGDLVTMRWWDDLWLNESFATYASTVALTSATRWTEAWTNFINRWKAFGYVGYDGFFAGLRHYFKRHAWGNTSLADLLSALEETSGRDMSAWAEQWLSTAGVNTLRPDLSVDEKGVITSFAVLQEADPRWPTLRTHRVAIGVYDKEPGSGGPAGGDRLVRRHQLELDIAGPRTGVPDLVGVARGDLILLNDDDLTYAKVRLDPVSLATAVSSVSSLESSLARSLCWISAWDMVRDGEMPAREYVAMVLGGVGSEPDIGVVDALVGRRAATALDEYADPAWRPEGRRQVAARMRELLETAEPGGDHQLAWARTLVWAAETDDDLAFVRGLLSGDVAVDGLTVDPDLRWRAVTRLASAGLFGEEDIDAERARDATTQGEERAATARAAQPTAAAKAAAWAKAVGEVEVTNTIQTATAFGFVQPDQAAVLEPYVERYFVEAPAFFDRVFATAKLVVTPQLYPRWRIEQSTLDRTDAFLATEGLPPVLARMVLESRDHLSPPGYPLPIDPHRLLPPVSTANAGGPQRRGRPARVTLCDRCKVRRQGYDQCQRYFDGEVAYAQRP
jgi:aminopeptidase N